MKGAKLQLMLTLQDLPQERSTPLPGARAPVGACLVTV